MRALIQRVSGARVTVAGDEVAKVENGFVVFVGITHSDGMAEAEYLARKIVGLRIFEDRDGRLNLDLAEVGGSILAVSQFTLYGNVRKGRRPSFTDAARPENAEPLYEAFCTLLEENGVGVERGVFQAHMHVSLTNDGPVTLWMDTQDLMRG